jgi:tRNA modification GTPase
VHKKEHVLADLIAAISTSPGYGFRSIIRLSGDGAIEAAARLIDAQDAQAVLDAPGFSSVPVRALNLPAHVFVFRAPRSYTREDLAEIHLPTGRPLADVLLDRAINAGARVAEPGEFTKRAFLNGRISLAAAEGVLALITARERAAAREGLRLLSGEAPRQVREARELLRSLYTEVTASLDFSEEDIDFITRGEVIETLDRLHNLLGSFRDTDSKASGVRVVLAGEVNSGKTTLFNALAGENALVSSVPGTTRDALHARLHIAGREILLIDLPGLSSPDELSRLTAEVARKEIRTADILLLCVPADAPHTSGGELSEALRGSAAEAAVLIATKCDLAPPDAAIEAARGLAQSALVPVAGAATSDLNDKSRVRAALEAAISSGKFEHAPVAAEVVERAVRGAAALIEEARRAAAEAMLDAASALIEAAIRALDAPFIPGGSEIDEAALAEIFSRFCVGK